MSSDSTENMNYRPRRLPPMPMVRLAAALRRFFLKTADRMLPAPFVLMEKASAFWTARAIEVAASLNIATLLKKGPLPVESLAAQTGCKAPALLRLLRTLAGEGIFRETSPGVFANNKMSDALTDGRDSMQAFIMHHLGDTNWQLVGDMLQCLKTGENAMQRIHGMQAFEFLSANPESNALFNKAMRQSSEMAAHVMVHAFPFSLYPLIADVGGGNGYFLSRILQQHTRCRGILFDQPHVTEPARQHALTAGAENRFSILPGDFFNDPLPEASLYILKNVIHDWNDEDALKILSNVAAAMPATAELLLIETIIKPDNKPSFGKLLDLQMLIGTPGGRERTRDEYSRLLKAAGLRLRSVRSNATPFSFITASRH